MPFKAERGNAPAEALPLCFFLSLRGPISLHALRLCLSLCGTPALLLGRSGCQCGGQRLIFRRSAPPLRRALKSLNSAVQFVTFCNQQRDDVFGRHKLLRIPQRGSSFRQAAFSVSRNQNSQLLSAPEQLLRWRLSHGLQ